MPYYLTEYQSDIVQLQNSKIHSFGSGRLIARNLVLSATHIFQDSDKKVVEENWLARLEKDRTEERWRWQYRGNVIWYSTDFCSEIALIKLVDLEGFPPEPPLEPVFKSRFAKISQNIQHPVEMLGYPKASIQNSNESRKKIIPVKGKLIATTEDEPYILTVPKENGPQKPYENWQGVSGSSVILDLDDNSKRNSERDLWIYGTVLELSENFENQFFISQLSKALESPEFIDILSQAGVKDIQAEDPLNNQTTSEVYRGRSVTSPGEGSASDLIVIMSEADGRYNSSLKYNVENALQILSHEEQGILGSPNYIYVSQVDSSEEQLSEIIELLCKCKVAIFDITDYEPLVLFFLGIRAVARNSVTILSIGGKRSLMDIADLPFSLKDANIVCHSEAQDVSGNISPAFMLRSRLRSSLRERDAAIEDLPVFNAVRGMPSEDLDRYSDKEGILVLCSFSADYTEKVWEKILRKALSQSLESKRSKDTRYENKLNLVGISRSFELNSPRLVSRAIFDYLRWHNHCVIDFTEFSPNVFFEFGVRVSSNKGMNDLLIDKQYLEFLSAFKRKEKVATTVNFRLGNITSEALTDNTDSDSHLGIVSTYLKQFGIIDRLFQIARYNSEVEWASQDELKNLGYAPSSDFIFQTTGKYIDLVCQPSSIPVEYLLLENAHQFSKDRTKGISATLYPYNTKLLAIDSKAEFDRLLAAYLFLSRKVDFEKIEQGEEIDVDQIDLLSISRVTEKLFSNHMRRLNLEENTGFKKSILKLKRLIDTVRSIHG